MRTSWTAVVLICSVLASGSPTSAQQPNPQTPPPVPPTPAARPEPTVPIIPLKVEIVLAKYQGDKKVSSTPFTLSVNTNTGKASIRMGADVPVPAYAIPRQPDGSLADKTPTYQYRSVGTNIDCFAQTFDRVEYRLNVSIEDTSVYPSTEDMPGSLAGAPTLRTFRASNEVILRDGGSTEFLAATDKVSGEVIKAEVKLTVVK